MSSSVSNRASRVFTPPPALTSAAATPEAKSKGNASSANKVSPALATLTSVFEAVGQNARAPSTGAAGTKGDALKDIDSLLKPANEEKVSYLDDESAVVRDGLGEGDFSPEVQSKCEDLVAKNKGLETQALSKLSPADRSKYQDVKQAIGDTLNAGPHQLALQKMLFKGDLPGGKDLKGQGSTLDQLHQAATAKHAPGVDPGQLAGTLARELATPSSISQGQRGTCAPTAAGISLAKSNPAEYARIVNGLASPEGKVELADGKTTLERGADTSLAYDGTNRSLDQRLLAPAFQELANQDRDYNDKTGEGAGTSTSGLNQLSEALYGKDLPSLKLGSPKQTMSNINQAVSRGDNALVGMRTDPTGDKPGGHMLLVTGTSTRDGQDCVDYINPWGQKESMPVEDFVKHAGSFIPVPGQATPGSAEFDPNRVTDLG